MRSTIIMMVGDVDEGARFSAQPSQAADQGPGLDGLSSPALRSRSLSACRNFSRSSVAAGCRYGVVSSWLGIPDMLGGGVETRTVAQAASSVHSRNAISERQETRNEACCLCIEFASELRLLQALGNQGLSFDAAQQYGASRCNVQSAYRKAST